MLAHADGTKENWRELMDLGKEMCKKSIMIEH
jgi:hypothetical protein